jgi:indole-3-glycerol phosphate synthase
MPDAPSVLRRILRDIRLEVERRSELVPERELELRARDVCGTRSFGAAIRDAGFALIAEFKRASPSKGAIFPDADPATISHAYETAGAQALSVLTNDRHFGGSDKDLLAVREATNLPVLRKDFTVSTYQIYEARVLGADAVLLIVAALSDHELREFVGLAEGIGLTALVETHTLDDVERALAVGARLIGINNRDLRTFETSLETTVTLRKHIPGDVTVISESGIHTRADAELLRQSGVQGILVGESLMRAAKETAGSLERFIADLLGSVSGMPIGRKRIFA